jgi:hypothetical protein
MMLAVLPRRSADEISGELFVAAYERQLGGMPKAQAEYMLDRALKTCRWFPTISECIELANQWRRQDDDTRARTLAKKAIQREEEKRRRDQAQWSERSSMLMTQEQVDAMSESLQSIGLKCGALYKDDEGKVRPVREIEGCAGF